MTPFSLCCPKEESYNFLLSPNKSDKMQFKKWTNQQIYSKHPSDSALFVMGLMSAPIKQQGEDFIARGCCFLVLSRCSAPPPPNCCIQWGGGVFCVTHPGTDFQRFFVLPASAAHIAQSVVCNHKPRWHRTETRWTASAMCFSGGYHLGGISNTF